MLQNLNIRNIVLIEALSLDFQDGLSVLTGETGAGKSILLDSLGLVLGARAESSLVRNGCDKAQVIATFETPSGALLSALQDNEIECEPDESLIIRRSLKADGGSKAYINDQPCSAALLRIIGRYLVEIHGQHDDRGLLNPSGHRDLLDNYGRCNSEKVAHHYRDWKEAAKALETARASLDQAERDREWLEHSVEELQAFNPIDGEEEELAGERSDMQKGERLTEELKSVLSSFDGKDSGVTKLRASARKLERIAPEHPTLSEALSSLDRAIIEANEAESKLNEASFSLTFDPQRLDDIEVRLFELRALARKHNVAPDALGVLLSDLSEKLSTIQAGGEGLAKLEAEVESKRQSYFDAARELSQKRQKAAKALDKAVISELIPLKLDAAKFQTDVALLDESRWGESGMDKVEFLISTNPDAPFAPLTKIASGGELSRFILALKVALAEEGGAQTIIFDEIDRGVGGAVASAIGERLFKLAQSGKQMLAVTHSPQVAAKGSAHYYIAKSSSGPKAGIVTRTDVKALNSDDRRQEIARMLSGAEVTEEAKAQADRLLEVV